MARQKRYLLPGNHGLIAPARLEFLFDTRMIVKQHITLLVGKYLLNIYKGNKMIMFLTSQGLHSSRVGGRGGGNQAIEAMVGDEKGYEKEAKSSQEIEA